MKTQFASLVAMLLLSPWAHSASAITFAPSAGITNTTIKGSDISGSRTGMLIGALVEYELANPQIQLETGLLYAQKGAKNDALFASVEYELGYLDIPLGARYFFMEPKQSWYVRGGATLAYLVSAKEKAQVFGLEAQSDVKSKTNAIDILPYAGVGYAWLITDGQVLGVDLNYTRGLLDVFKDAKSNSQGLIFNASYSLAF